MIAVRANFHATCQSHVFHFCSIVQQRVGINLRKKSSLKIYIYDHILEYALVYRKAVIRHLYFAIMRYCCLIELVWRRAIPELCWEFLGFFLGRCHSNRSN